MSEITPQQRADWRDEAEQWLGSSRLGDFAKYDQARILALLDALDAAEEERDWLRNELRVEELHADGAECDVCTHLEYEQMDQMLNAEMDRSERAEAERDEAVAKVARVVALAEECAASGCIHLNTMWGRLRAALDTPATEGGEVCPECRNTDPDACTRCITGATEGGEGDE